MKIKAVLFDMDGTVLDTEPVYKNAWKSAFERSGHKYSEKLMDNCIGLSVNLMRDMINESYNDPDLFETLFQMAAAWAHNYKKLNGVPVKPGFYELSDYLIANNIKAVIATSTSHDAAIDDLKNSKIIDRFLGVVGGNDVENTKPAPDPYTEAAKLAGVSVDDCIAVEDSAVGVRSAVAAGVKCIYIKDFLDIPPEIEATAYKRLNSLDEIIKIIS